MPPNHEPFPEHVERLARERGRRLSKVLEDAHLEDVRGTSPDLFKRVRRGEMPPRRTLIESIARVLGVPPWTFGEWRLLAARDAIDPQPGRVEAALANLKAIEAGATGEEVAKMVSSALPPAGGAPQAPAGALGRDLRDDPTSAQSRPRKRHRRAPDARADIA